MPPPYFLLRDSMKKRTGKKYPVAPAASRYAVNIVGLQKKYVETHGGYEK